MEKSEYEIQHFGFSAEQVSLERRHFLNNMVSLALDSMVKHMSEDNPDRFKLLEQQKGMVRHAMQETFEKYLPEAEVLDRNNFSIPEYVLLASDYGHAHQYTEQDEEDIDKEIETMKSEFLENSVMIATINADNAKYAAMEPFVQEEIATQLSIEVKMTEVEVEWVKFCDLVKETKNLLKKANES